MRKVYDDLYEVTREYIMEKLQQKKNIEFLYSADDKDWFRIDGRLGWAPAGNPIFGVIY